MTGQSLKTISQSNLDLEHTQVLKMGGSHLGNKFSKVVPFNPETITENLKMIS